MAQKSRADIRRGIHSRIRKKIRGTANRPRLAVFRSLKHIYAQVIDDVNGETLASASSVESALKVKSGGDVEGAVQIGKAIAERALSAGIEQVVFDRGGYVYHGRVKALLDATRTAGLNKNENGSDKADEKSTEEKTEKKAGKKEAPKKKTDKKKADTKKEKAPAKKKETKKEEAKKDTTKDSKEKTKKQPKVKKDSKAKAEKQNNDNE